MRERRDVMRLHIQNGISDLNSIKNSYNMFGNGEYTQRNDNTTVYSRERIAPITLTNEQQQNWKWYGTLNKPQIKQTYLNQGRKLTPTEQKASDKKLKEQENLQNYQKQKEKEAHDLQHAVEVAPYVIPGLGQAMWAGKAVDVATNKLSNDKYRSWGDMVNQTTGSGELVGDITNPGYYAGALAKVASPLVKEGLVNVGEYLTTQTPLKDTYKINPLAFKPNPDSYYHRSPNLQNIINEEKGILQGFGESTEGKLYTENAYKPTGGINLNKGANNQLYFSKGVPLDYGRYNPKKLGMSGQGYKGPYLVEVENVPMGASVNGRTPKLDPPTNLEGYAVSHRPINVNEAKFYKEHWLKGYKDVTPKTNNNFQSEINWGNWNKEIPSNKPLMDEYLQIEKTAKQNGTWMKNSDGSKFEGTPEQFVQQNSSNFKKSGLSKTKYYHGSPNKNIVEFHTPKSDNYIKGGARGTGEEGIYITPNKSYASRYEVPDLMKGGEKGKTYELYSNANPIEFSNFKDSPITDFYKMPTSFRKNVEDLGYNSVSNSIKRNMPEVVVFKPTQLKSAIGNNGMFDMTNPNIYKGLIPAAGLYGLFNYNE